jgi:hypothetical protein
MAKEPICLFYIYNIMKHIKLFESFEGFPNTEEEIDRICRKYGIMDYTINEDMSIDVDGSVSFYDRGLSKIPLKFNKVSRDFGCNDNKLTTLEGSPKEVGGHFYCNYNQLTTLEGSPKEVGGNFHCGNNKLTTLEGAPKYVGGYFYCRNNPVYSLYVLFNDYKWFKNSIKEYSWLHGTEIIEHRLIDVFLDDNKPAPDLSKIDKIYTIV